MTEERAKELIKADRAASEEFFNSLTSEDALGVVIRAHIQLESILQAFIRLMAPCPQEVKFGAMDFDQTLQLALILGLDSRLKPSLSAIGRLRNKFAHRLDMVLTKEIADNLYEALPPFGKDSVQKMYKSVLNRTEGPADFKAAHPKGRVALCLVSVRAMLRVQLARGTHEFAESVVGVSES
jgi:hypothetical protein